MCARRRMTTNLMGAVIFEPGWLNTGEVKIQKRGDGFMQTKSKERNPINTPVLYLTLYQLWQPGSHSVERLRSTVLRPGLSTGLPLSDFTGRNVSKILFFNLVN